MSKVINGKMFRETTNDVVGKNSDGTPDRVYAHMNCDKCGNSLATEETVWGSQDWTTICNSCASN